MKKLVYTLMFLVGFATVSFAQEAPEIAISEGTTELAQSKIDGNYVFILSGKTKADIIAASTYYEHYFTIDFNESSQTVKISMVENNERGRPVIVRFLVASGVRYVDVDGKNVSVSDFMSSYLQ